MEGGEDLDDNIIIPYIEPIFRFCCKRLSNRYDAEDLASEIICYILDGMKKYKIESLNAWIWQIVHNRYARFLAAQSKMQITLAEDEALFNVVDSDYWDVDEEQTEHDALFTARSATPSFRKCLTHMPVSDSPFLGRQWRNRLTDYSADRQPSVYQICGGNTPLWLYRNGGYFFLLLLGCPHTLPLRALYGIFSARG